MPKPNFYLFVSANVGDSATLESLTRFFKNLFSDQPGLLSASVETTDAGVTVFSVTSEEWIEGYRIIEFEVKILSSDQSDVFCLITNCGKRSQQQTLSHFYGGIIATTPDLDFLGLGSWLLSRLIKARLERVMGICSKGDNPTGQKQVILKDNLIYFVADTLEPLEDGMKAAINAALSGPGIKTLCLWQNS